MSCVGIGAEINGILDLLPPFRDRKKREQRGDDKPGKEFRIEGSTDIHPENKHAPDVMKGIFDMIHPEEYPADIYNKEGEKNRGDLSDTV